MCHCLGDPCRDDIQEFHHRSKQVPGSMAGMGQVEALSEAFEGLLLLVHCVGQDGNIVLFAQIQEFGHQPGRNMGDVQEEGQELMLEWWQPELACGKVVLQVSWGNQDHLPSSKACQALKLDSNVHHLGIGQVG